MISGLFDKTIALLGNSMDLRASRQKLISSNIANQETPGYRAMDINFEQELKRREGEVPAGERLISTNSLHFSEGSTSAPPPIVLDRVTDLTGYDQNSVGIEGEMSRLSENSTMYNASVRMLKSKFNILMTAIKEGK